MNGLHEQVDQRPVLVIGIHREELGFGSMVAKQLVSEDIDLIRIDKGLSHEKSWYRSGFYHSAAHREMYLQLHQQLKGKTHFVIDLHTGINEAGRCADILCSDIRMLRFMQEKLDAITSHPLSPPGEERLYQIIEPDTRPSKGERFFPACHTIIPMSVW
ncbi:MAG TPA: hypothetical protein ENK89_01920, partial [Desulfobulbaceae bacterium]|nr:hypothetical protein [Desulfobulbaceae bacterium]